MRIYDKPGTWNDHSYSSARTSTSKSLHSRPLMYYRVLVLVVIFFKHNLVYFLRLHSTNINQSTINPDIIIQYPQGGGGVHIVHFHTPFLPLCLSVCLGLCLCLSGLRGWITEDWCSREFLSPIPLPLPSSPFPFLFSPLSSLLPFPPLPYPFLLFPLPLFSLLISTAAAYIWVSDGLWHS